MSGKIEILMATYNGAAFIRQQISSIKTQTFTDWVLRVHDDGSSDRTVEIIREMAADDARIELLDDGLTFHSPAMNFMHLLKHSEADYIIFSDQDDIWLENKLQLMYEEIIKHSMYKPLAVYSNGYIYNCNTNDISGRSILSGPKNLGNVLFQNGGIQGCAIMMNRALTDICRNHPDFICMHDHLVTLAAFTFGRMVYVDQKLMLYRRHSDAVTDVSAGNFMEKAKLFAVNRKPILDARHVKAIRAFYECYKNMMSAETRQLYDLFFRLLAKGRLYRVYAILRYPFGLYNSKLVLLAKMLFRPFM